MSTNRSRITARFTIVLAAVLLFAVGCTPRPDPDPDPGVLVAALAFSRAAAGDEVTVLFPAGGAGQAGLELAGAPLPTSVAADGRSFTFTVPASALPGPAAVRIHRDDSQEVLDTLTILGSVDTRELLLIVHPSLSLAGLDGILARHGLPALAEGELVMLYPDGDPGNPCSGQLAVVT